MPPLVIQTENLPQVCSDWLAERCDLHVCQTNSLRFEELLPTASGLVIRTYTTVDQAMIESAVNLVVVGRAGGGIDNIDLVACKKHDIRIVHTPEANSESVVEFVLSRMLASVRKTTRVDRVVDQKEWNLLRDNAVNPRQFDEMTLGIIGFGRIGSKLGNVAATLGFQVLFHDLLQIDNTQNCTQVPLEQLLLESDIISVHVDGRKDNTHLCNTEFFQNLKSGAIFINTSRGFVVEASSLANHLRHDLEATAILDVHDPEPIQSTYPLLDLPNVELYPHIACKTKTATINMGWVVRDVLAVIKGETPVYEVDLAH